MKYFLATIRELKNNGFDIEDMRDDEVISVFENGDLDNQNGECIEQSAFNPYFYEQLKNKIGAK